MLVSDCMFLKKHEQVLIFLSISKPVIWQVPRGGAFDIMKGKAVFQLREKLGSAKYGIFS